uniref:Peptidase M17 leucyl aminopeptidase N-terminal domain-containing protein n=1 Tax=Phlebotomus papatasi TaxID=29031 RepID=A0A1B0EYF5_PHLPP
MILLSRLRLLSRPTFRVFSSYPSQADAPLSTGSSKGLVVGLYEHPEKDYCLTECGEQADSLLKGRLRSEIERCGMRGKSGEVRMINGLPGDFYSVAIVGLGPQDASFSVQESLDTGLENVRIAAALGALRLRDDYVSEISLDPMGHPEEVAEGATLALWEYQDNRRLEDRMKAVALECYNCLDEDAWTVSWTATDFPFEQRKTSPTLKDIPEGIFSHRGITARMLMGKERAAAALTAETTTAAPLIVALSNSMSLAGFRHNPPLLKVTPLPINRIGRSPVSLP